MITDEEIEREDGDIRNALAHSGITLHIDADLAGDSDVALNNLIRAIHEIGYHLGRQHQRESDSVVATKFGDSASGYEIAAAISSNTGELK